MHKEKIIYSIYKGDKFLGVGTAKELAKQLNIKARTVYYYTSPAYRKRCKGNTIIAFKLEDEI